ncbi:Plant disease resistance response protein [Macleaya cordata]|uniref:Dirigent protein n=1 Tax=Macleaya cordata TaxID=56857 RepID=A0A200Q754_MACCD|nr:Plant disease resistance response protein [Macleaya cordata]
MGVLALLLLNLSLVVITVLVTQTQAANWAHEIPYEDLGKEKVTKLHFYFHDIVGGDNPTAVRVAEAPMTNKSATLFGAVVMVDDPLTEGPEITSRLVGRAQGFYGSAGQKEGAILMAISYIFTDEKFNGSILNVLSRNPFTTPVREFSIVGGTGLFRYARGFVQAKTYFFNNDGAVVEYNVTAIHY